MAADWEYEKINAELSITPTVHLHLHLRECVEKWILAVQL